MIPESAFEVVRAMKSHQEKRPKIGRLILHAWVLVDSLADFTFDIAREERVHRVD